MDLVHHAAQRMPANPSFEATSIKAGPISCLMTKKTGSGLFNNPDFDMIGSLPLSSLLES